MSSQLPRTSSRPGYFNTRTDTDGVEDIRFFRDRRPQSRELNELPDILRQRIDSIGDSIYSDGDVVKGAEAIVGPAQAGLAYPNVTVTVQDGQVYLRGKVYNLPGAVVPVPNTGKVKVGVRFRLREVDQLTHPDMVNDPAPGGNFAEPGAGRLLSELQWGWKSLTTPAQDPLSDWDFYPVYEVQDGVLILKVSTQDNSWFLNLLASYDYNANENYIVRGFGVRFVTQTETHFVLTVGAGLANLLGYQVERGADLRFLIEKNPDTLFANNEPHVFAADPDGRDRIWFNRPPLATLGEVFGVARKTEAVVKGFSGGADDLPDSSIVLIQQIVRGATVYQQGVSWTLVGGRVQWAPSPAPQPAAGETYEVTYQCQQVIDVPLEDQFADHIVIGGGGLDIVEGSFVNVDYHYKLPRVDLLVLNGDGTVSRIAGIPRLKNPEAPKASRGQIALAEVEMDWRDAPIIREATVRAFPMWRQQAVEQRLALLELRDAARELQLNATIREPAARYDIFADPLFDDDMRDGGIPQTGAIVEGGLVLPITGESHILDWPVGHPSHGNNGRAWTLPYVNEVMVDQPQMTACLRINPYQAFDPLPAKMTLDPAVDRWTVNNTVWLSPITRRFTRRGGRNRVRTTRSAAEVSEASTAAVETRVRSVAFRVEGFGPGETIAAATFDGVALAGIPGMQASPAGLLEGTFMIPAGVPSGIKEVNFTGTGGSEASARYIAEGTVVTSTMQEILTVTVTRRRRRDPLAQTFTPVEDSMVSSVDVKFCAIGDRNLPVLVQIREVELGIPSGVILAETRVSMATIVAGTWKNIAFDIPVSVRAGQEYALVFLTNDALHAMAIARLGEYAQAADNDGDEGWVTSQPDTVGTLLKSANASTWLPDPAADLCYRLNRARFTALTRTVLLGRHAIVEATDLQVTASVLLVSAETDVRFQVNQTTASVTDLVEEGQGIEFTERRTDTVEVAAHLSGTEYASPVLFPGTQLLVGQLQGQGSYVSRSFKGSAEFSARIICSVFKPGTSTVEAAMFGAQLDGTGAEIVVGGVQQTTFHAAALHSVTPGADGFAEYEWRVFGVHGVGLERLTKLRLLLNGTARDRVEVREIRVITK